MYEENRPGVGAPERPALRRVPRILHESSTWYHLRSAVSNTGAIFVPIFKEVCMKVTKLPSGNYRCRVYVGTDDTGKHSWKSFTGPNRKRVEQGRCQSCRGPGTPPAAPCGRSTHIPFRINLRRKRNGS